VRVSEPGPLTDEITLLGSPQTTSYLVKGEVYALLGGGTAWGVPRIEEQLDRFRIDRGRIRYVVVSHVHHDHCGAVPYLVQRYPWIEVVASAYGAELLAKAKPVRVMRDLNARTLDRLGRSHSHDGVPLDFEEFAVSHPVAGGAELALGRGLTLRFVPTPGHSRCSMTTYLQERRVLFPGDSIPYPERGRAELTVTANHDYADYLASLEALSDLPIEIVAYEHGGALTGDGARTVIARGQEASLRQRQRIRRRLHELGDLELLVEETAAKYRTLELFQVVPADDLRAIVRRMVRSAVRDT
jgi:2-aminobenzoylacetyl-CoA thioesterase